MTIDKELTIDTDLQVELAPSGAGETPASKMCVQRLRCYKRRGTLLKFAVISKYIITQKPQYLNSQRYIKYSRQLSEVHTYVFCSSQLLKDLVKQLGGPRLLSPHPSPAASFKQKETAHTYLCEMASDNGFFPLGRWRKRKISLSLPTSKVQL